MTPKRRITCTVPGRNGKFVDFPLTGSDNAPGCLLSDMELFLEMLELDAETYQSEKSSVSKLAFGFMPECF
jgi:hypothetical protein